MDDDRFTEIEVKLAHQERALEEVNRILTDQQAQLSRLEQACQILAGRLRAMSDSVPEENGGAEKPPHY